MTKFMAPDFSSGSLELRCENETVCIYGNREGLRELMRLCQSLLDHPSHGHIHLEDRGLLTKESLIGAIALFPGTGSKP